MSRKSNRNRPGGNINYNRQSGGYQKNLYKQKLKEEGVEMPKTVNEKKLRIITIALGVVWIIATVLLIINLKWWGLLIGLVIGVAVVGSLYLYLNNKQKQMIRYYKKLGMTEEMYVSELKRRNTDPKQIENFRKIWRKTKVE